MTSNSVPELYSIFHGEVASLQTYGAFVKIPGCKKQGLVHKSQMSSAKIDDPSEMLAKGEKIYCKVIAMEGSGEKISLSMKVVNQTTGQDLDPNNVQSSQDEKKRRQWKTKDKSKIQLGAELNTTCRKCGGHGHLAMDCFGRGGADEPYELIPDLDELTKLPPKVETKKKKKKKSKKKEKHTKKKRKDKKKRSSSSSSSSSASESSEDEKYSGKKKRKRSRSASSSSSSLSPEDERNVSKKENRNKISKEKRSRRSVSSESFSDNSTDERRKSKTNAKRQRNQLNKTRASPRKYSSSDRQIDRESINSRERKRRRSSNERMLPQSSSETPSPCRERSKSGPRKSHGDSPRRSKDRSKSSSRRSQRDTRSSSREKMSRSPQRYQSPIRDSYAYTHDRKRQDSFGNGRKLHDGRNKPSVRQEEAKDEGGRRGRKNYESPEKRKYNDSNRKTAPKRRSSSSDRDERNKISEKNKWERTGRERERRSGQTMDKRENRYSRKNNERKKDSFDHVRHDRSCS